MTILVTGATGLLGNNVTRLLVERQQRVRVLIRGSSDRRPLEGLPLEILEGDVCDRESVDRACDGVRGIVHSAADVRIGWSRFEQQRRVNAGGTKNVAEAALARKLPLVHVSTVDTLGVASRDRVADEDTPPGGKIPCGYVLTKLEAERHVLELVPRGLKAVVVNPGMMFGPWDWKPSSGRIFLETVRRYTPFAASGGACVCDARDVAAGTLAALERGATGRRYVLGGHNLSHLELWRQFARVAGSRPPWAKAGPLMRFFAGRWGDLCGWVAGREFEVNSAAVGMSSLLSHYSSARAERELGYDIRPLEETLRDTWAWFRTHGYA